MSLEATIAILIGLAIGINGWALTRIVSLDGKFADLNRWISERIIFDNQRHASNIERLDNLIAEVERCRVRLHNLEGSVANKEGNISDLLDRLDAKVEECNRYRQALEEERRRRSS